MTSASPHAYFNDGAHTSGFRAGRQRRQIWEARTREVLPECGVLAQDLVPRAAHETRAEAAQRHDEQRHELQHQSVGGGEEIADGCHLRFKIGGYQTV